MNPCNQSAVIAARGLKREFPYGNTVVLTMSVSFMEVRLPGSPMAESRINRRIRMQTGCFYRRAALDLYRQAAAGYRDSVENGFPFHAYEAVLDYHTAYNRNCYLSAFRDQYEFTGGAHGNTVRSSDTWRLGTGRTVPLSCFFRDCTDYKSLLLEQILKQADNNMQQEPVYFEDYRTLIPKYFDPKSYYLTPDGIAFYFQQYQIAPYSTGIVVFTLPYGMLDCPPSCSG